MKTINFNQSLKNLVNNLKGLFILSLALTTFGVGNAWGATWYGHVDAYSSPSQKGWIWVTLKGSKFDGNFSNDVHDESSNDKYNWSSSADFTAQFYAKPKDGYGFKGWFDNASGTGTNYSSSTANNCSYSCSLKATSKSESSPTNLTRYALFTPNTYTIAFDGNVNTGGSTSSITATYDQNYTLPTNGFTKTGYSFAGWKLNNTGNTYAVGASVTNLTTQNKGTVTFYAQWTANQYDVKYDAQEGYIDGKESKTIPETYDGKYTCPTPTRDGYDFQGWYTETNGKGTKITTNSAVTTAGNHTLYAHWQVVNVVIKNAENKTVDFIKRTETLTTTLAFPVEKATSTSNFNRPSSSNTEWTATAYSYSNNVVTVTLSFTATENVTTRGDHKSTITLTGKNGVSATGTVTAHVAMTPVLTDNVPTNKLVGEASIDLNTLWTSTSNGVKTYTIKTWTPDGGAHNGGAVTPAINGSTLSLGDAGKLVLQLSQAAGTSSEAKTAEHTLTINRRDNNIFINGSKDSYQASIYMEAQQAINLTATNTDYSGSPITATQTAGNTIAALNAAQTQVTSNHNLGDATWTVSQPENYKYKAANATFTIHVVKQAEITDCYVLKPTSEASLNTISKGNAIAISGPADKLYFDIKYDGTIFPALYLHAEYSTDNGNNWIEVTEINERPDSYKQFGPYSIASNATHVRFETTVGSTNKVYYKNVRVTRKTYLNASDFTINTQSDNTTLIYPGKTGTGSFHVDYSLANGGDLKIVCDNPKFTIDKTTQTNVDCKTGSFDVNMTYTSQNAGTDYAHVVIYNKVYRKEITVTGITQKHQQTLNWKENFDKMSKGSEEKNAASSSHGLVTYKSDDPDIIRVDNDKNGHATILVAVAKGETKITATAAGDDEYDSKSISKTISVTEDHVQYIIWNQSLMGLKYELGSTKNLNAYATSEEEGNIASSRPITYTSDNTSVVTVNGNQLTITGIGTANITARQAGGNYAGITYEAVEKTNKVVIKDPSAKCESFVYEQGEQAEEFFQMNTNEIIGTVHTLNGEPAKLTFYAKREYWKLGINYSKGNIVVDAYTPTGGWQQVLDCGEPPIGSYTEYSVNLSRNVTKIRFRRPSGGQGYHYIADAKIERARYIETTTPPVFQANVGEVQEHKISLNYSNITSDLLLTLAGGATSHFSIDKTTIEGECGDAKKNIELTISYAPTKDTEGNVDGKEQETLNITDGTTVYQVPLYGKASKVDQHIVWDINDNNNVYTIEQVTLTATTKTNLDQAAGELAYHTVGATTAGCATIDNNILSFSKDGIVYVEAYTIASDKYNPATSVTKSWTVSKTPTKVTTNPTISGDVISGTDIASLILNGGAAQNIVNNQAVEGTFAITGGNLVNVGQQTLTITFTPDNTDMYESCTTTISVNVVQREATAEEVGTPSATSITYGNAINTSVLSGNGSLAGTWSWVDEDANKATPNVGTVDNLNVIFTPNDGNVNPVAATVSLTVTKADAQLTWTTAPANVEISETVTYVATSNHSESAITYSITAGGEYATIDATTGVLTMKKAGTITVQAAQAATANYNATTTSTTTTITGQLENKFTNAAGDNDWKNEENWTNGVPTEENPDVIIAGEVTIDEPISVGGLTIEVNGKVTVVDNGSLNVYGTSADRDTYGNLFIKNGGDVTIATEGNVRVNDFVIESSIGTQGVSESGQITNADRVLYVNGAYIDINLDPTGKANDTQWYGFTVPFPVDIYDGVARKEGDTFRKVTYGTDYIFAEYDMDQRFNSGKGWKNISTHQLQPGRFYYITFNGDYNTYSFKAATDTITSSYETNLITNGEGPNANWNAVGNSALRHVTASYGTTDNETETFVQVYQNGLSQYQTVRTSDATFVVGCPFFVQAKTNTVLQLTDADNDPVDNTYAPLRKVSKANRSIKMVIAPENGGYSDQVYMRTTTDVKSEYIIGRDLAKAGVGTATVQMWINAYGQKLSVNETEIVGEEAIFPLGIYAPKAGGYRLTIDETSTPTYLMENGVVIWDFANGSYVVDLSKGTNNDYSIVRTAPNAPGEATDIYSAQQNNQHVNKVIFRNKMYIIHNAHTYDAQGQTIR